MSPTSLTHRLQLNLHALDDTIARGLGADLRMIYGFGVPIVLMSVLIVLMMLSASTWAVAAAMVLEVASLGLVLAGFLSVFDEAAPDEG
jgi:hypothetical protein